MIIKSQDGRCPYKDPHKQKINKLDKCKNGLINNKFISSGLSDHNAKVVTLQLSTFQNQIQNLLLYLNIRVPWSRRTAGRVTSAQ